MKKTRIVERRKRGIFGYYCIYTIQVKHPLFFWMWINGNDKNGMKDTFRSFKKAKKNLKYFNGKKSNNSIKVVHKNY